MPLPTAENHQDALDLFKGVFYNLLGMVLKLGKVLFVLVAAHFYGATALGLYFLAWSAVDIASKFGLWGMDKTLLRDIARYNGARSAENDRLILNLMSHNIRFALLAGAAATVLLFILAPWIAVSIYSDAALIGPLRILSLAIPFIVVTLVLLAATKALRQMQYEAFVRQGLEPAVLLLMALLLIFLRRDAGGLAVAHLTASMVAAAASFYIVWRKFSHLPWPPAALTREQKRETLCYASPIAATDFLNLSVARADIMLVGVLLNSTAAGLYGIAVEIISLIKRVRQGLEPIFAPIVAELYHSGQAHRLQRNYQLVTRWLMAGSLLPVIAMLLFPDQILALFGVQSAEAAAALMLLAAAHGLFGTFSAAESLLVMSGRTTLNALLGALMLIVNLTAGWLLIPRIGLSGAAVGTLLAFVVVSIGRIYHGYRQLHLWPFGTLLLWPLATAVAALALFYPLRVYLKVDSLWGTVALLGGLLLFYALLYLSGSMEPEEKFLFRKIKGRLKRNPSPSG